MCPVSNQPARLYETAESYKFDHSWGITKENIKFRLIIDQSSTCNKWFYVIWNLYAKMSNSNFGGVNIWEITSQKCY